MTLINPHLGQRSVAAPSVGFVLHFEGLGRFFAGKKGDRTVDCLFQESLESDRKLKTLALGFFAPELVCSDFPGFGFLMLGVQGCPVSSRLEGRVDPASEGVPEWRRPQGS
jgi:hypothetical protein